MINRCTDGLYNTGTICIEYVATVNDFLVETCSGSFESELVLIRYDPYATSDRCVDGVHIISIIGQ